MLHTEENKDDVQTEKEPLVTTITVNLHMANIHTGINPNTVSGITANAHNNLITMIEEMFPETGRSEQWVAFHRSPNDNIEVYLSSDNDGVYYLNSETEQEVRKIMDHELYLQFIKDKH